MTENSSSPLASRRVPIAILIGLMLFSGLVHGIPDGRWSQATDLKAQGDQLVSLPDTCGEWEVVSKSELDAKAMELLRCYGSTQRVYRNRETEATVNVAVLFGPRGPIAVHTPEVCYDSVGTEQTRDRREETITVSQDVHHLWSVEFVYKEESNARLEVWYAWSDGGSWQASKNPRFWMTDNLYKIQLAGPVAEGNAQPCRDFLEHFLPQLENVVL